MLPNMVRFLVLAVLCISAPLASQITLETTYQAGNGNFSNMFDVRANSNAVQITRLDTHTNATTAITYSVYIRNGTYRGNELNSAAWTLHDTVNTTGQGTGNRTAVALSTPIVVPANSTVAIYMYTVGDTRYTTGQGGAGTPNTYADANITIDCGCAVGGGGGAAFSGSLFDPRIWNGVVHYNLAGPLLTVSATAGTADSRYAHETGPGGDGIQAGRFDVTCNNQTGASLTAIEVTLSGTGNGQTAFSEVAVYEASAPGNTAFNHATDHEIQLHSSFPASNVLSFTVPSARQSFAANQTRRYFVVVKLAGTAMPGQTFNFQVTDITVTGTNASSAGTPSATMNGVVIATPVFNFADVSPGTASQAFLGSTGNVVQAFTIAYPNGPANKPASVTITGLGSGHEVNDLDDVQLFYDANDDGSLDAGDTLISTQTFTQANGTVTFSLNTLANFQAGDTRRFFVVYNLNLNGTDQDTFRCYVSAAGAATLGGNMNGLPVPDTSGAPGIIVSANILSFALNGPGTPAVVNSNAAGPTNDGVLLYDVTVSAAPGSAWTLNELTFTASGTGNHQNAYTEIAVYEDNGNGTWDGAVTDALASTSTPAGFDGSNEASFALINTDVAAGTSRRFFLVGILNGTAVAGQTFNAQLTDADYTPPQGGTVIGMPPAASAALVIDAAVLAVVNAGSQPAATTHITGTSAQYLVGQFVLSAINSDATVNGITLSGSGNGPWATALDAANGVQVWLDNGDGVFDAGTDDLLFQGAGGTSVNAAFSTPLNIANADSAALWVRLSLTNIAGQGASAAPHTFTLAISNGTDVDAGALQVVLGTPAPQTVTLGAIEFFVTSISPLFDIPAGGAALSLTGSGFMAPFVVRINGVVCPGTAQISGGTQVTGLFVPPGSGTNLTIEISSGNLPTYTHTQTFDYFAVFTGGGGGGGKGGGGCTTGAPALPAILLATIPALLAIRRRKANRA